jgi:hypothetical protein
VSWAEHGFAKETRRNHLQPPLPSSFGQSSASTRLMLRLAARRGCCAARGFASAASPGEQASTGGSVGVRPCAKVRLCAPCAHVRPAWPQRGLLLAGVGTAVLALAASTSDEPLVRCGLASRRAHLLGLTRRAAPATYPSPPPPWSRRCCGCSTARPRTTCPSGRLRTAWCRVSAVPTRRRCRRVRVRLRLPRACAAHPLLPHAADDAVGPPLSEPAGPGCRL